MKNRIDLIIKLILTAAILITLLFMAVPEIFGSHSEKSRAAIPSSMNKGVAPAGIPPGTVPGANGKTPKTKTDVTTAKPEGSNAVVSRENSRPLSVSSPATGQAVKAYNASRGTVSNYIKVNGDMITEVKIDIYPDVRGKLIEHFCSVGDYVKKDSIVAMVDPSLPGQTYAKSAVYSTINGTILSVNAREGDTVTTNSSIVTVGDLSDLQLQTFVPERHIGNLKLGYGAEAVFAAYPAEVYKAHITELNPVLDPQSRTMEIKLRLSRSDNRIKAGMFAAVKLVTEQADNVVSIPASSVFTYYGEETVFVIKENSVMKRTIELGLTTVDMVEVTKGLSPGEMVVTEGQNLLSDGSIVNVID